MPVMFFVIVKFVVSGSSLSRGRADYLVLRVRVVRRLRGSIGYQSIRALDRTRFRKR